MITLDVDKKRFVENTGRLNKINFI